jgi:asparagine synthase (glutamine-hydrolysing)
MCGIAGIINLTSAVAPDKSMVQMMTEQLNHRGPDSYGYYLDDDVALGHARLSIIDISGGKQPIHNEDQTVWVVFNGEIFNYVELRNELEIQGHKFYTRSDTEVIVHLYEEYGEEFVHHLNGQFAIAIWDKNNKIALLIRDRPGILPLYYTVNDGSVYFTSEIKSFKKILKNGLRTNPDAIDQLFTFWSPVSPATVFQDIFEVSPGCLLKITNKRIANRRYWDLPYPEDSKYITNESRASEQLYELLVDATRIRLRSDVPIGAYLSGGLDSSVITALIKNHTNISLRTFSLHFQDEAYDESKYQKLLIDALNADHSSILIRDEDIADNFIQTIFHTESPILRTAPIPMRILSKLVKDNGYKVVLTGEGSDEMLGGYDIFKETKIRHFWAKNPDSKTRPMLLKRLYPYLDLSQSTSRAFTEAFYGIGLNKPNSWSFSHLTRWITTAKCKEFYSSDFKAKVMNTPEQTLEAIMPGGLSRWHYFNRAQYIEAKTLMSGYLLCSQGDRMLMANSVEGRFPFLDHRVMEFSAKLHPNLKMKVLNEKYLLKKTMQAHLPPKITARYKQPYRAPDIPAFFRGQRRDMVYSILDSARIEESGIFDKNKVSILLKKIDKGRAIGYKDNMAFIGIMSTLVWYDQFIKN